MSKLDKQATSRLATDERNYTRILSKTCVFEKNGTNGTRLVTAILELGDQNTYE